MMVTVHLVRYYSDRSPGVQLTRPGDETARMRSVMEFIQYFNELTEDERQLFKACDYLDGLSYCIEERQRGNRTLQRVGDTYLIYLPAYLDSPEPWCARARELMSTLARHWRNLDER